MVEALLLVLVLLGAATLALVFLGRNAGSSGAKEMRTELAEGLDRGSKALISQLTSISSVQNNQIDAFSRQLQELRDSLNQRFETIRKENAEALEKMRVTVDEKLHATLEKRLGESFKLVSDRLEAVHKGQFEAARSLGLSKWHTLVDVSFPQAFKVALPPLVNNIVALLKDSSLAYSIGVVELTNVGARVQSSTFQPVPILITTAILYLVMTTLLTQITNGIEHRFDIEGRRP